MESKNISISNFLCDYKPYERILKLCLTSRKTFQPEKRGGKTFPPKKELFTLIKNSYKNISRRNKISW